MKRNREREPPTRDLSRLEAAPIEAVNDAPKDKFVPDEHPKLNVRADQIHFPRPPELRPESGLDRLGVNVDANSGSPNPKRPSSEVGLTSGRADRIEVSNADLFRDKVSKTEAKRGGFNLS